MIWQFKPSLVVMSVLLLSACSNQLNRTERAQDIANTPQLWQQAATSALKVEDNW
ncbi:MAG TPA: TolC family protein, partial [Pseudoalteromonas sp.]|nr:TolC family protein [Pseudoalteromonas sp.]